MSVAPHLFGPFRAREVVLVTAVGSSLFVALLQVLICLWPDRVLDGTAGAFIGIRSGYAPDAFAGTVARFYVFLVLVRELTPAVKLWRHFFV